jgi:hypothetical protein
MLHKILEVRYKKKVDIFTIHNSLVLLPRSLVDHCFSPGLWIAFRGFLFLFLWAHGRFVPSHSWENVDEFLFKMSSSNNYCISE